VINDGKVSQLNSFPRKLAELNICSPEALNSQNFSIHKYAKNVYEQEKFYYIKIITVRNYHKK